jgi:DNA processing protein
MKWDNKDLLMLSLINRLKSEEQQLIIDNFNSFDQFFENKDKVDDLTILNKLAFFENDIKKYKEKLDEQAEVCEKNNIKIISKYDAKYPKLLKEITNPPLVVFVQGELQPADSMSISMVGTRRATRYGKMNAERFAEFFAQNNIIVTSGLAYGIDTFSHLAAIKSGGISYAVIASGIDKLSPADSRKNADRIIEKGGAIISTYLCGVSAIPPFFLQRNRIIAGISKATLVVECGYKSGAMNTARNAFDESRDVFAIPGNITSEKSLGTNTLIKQNKAMLALTPKGVLEDLGIDKVYSKDQIKMEFTDIDEKNIYDTLSLEPLHIDEISDKTNMDISKILVKLLELEFKGAIKQLPGKFYIKNN